MSTPRPRPVRRRYDSARRQDQARATRHAILHAAAAQFAEHGYVGSTMDRIATAAGVAPETVYATFGNKRSILAALVDVAIAGDEEPAPLLERSWVHELAAEPDRDRRVDLLAHHGTRILARRSQVDEIVAQAAGADREAAALLAKGKAERHAGQRRLLGLVAGEDGPRAGLSLDDAADILFAVGSPEVYRLLVVDRGWSPERFEAWYADTMRRLLLRAPG
ncbi:MAG: helix-turn-helix domain-containing protein [Chloroflexota bacterium]